MRRVFAVSSLTIQTTRTRTLVVTRRHKLKLVVFSFGSNMSNPVIGVLPATTKPERLRDEHTNGGVVRPPTIPMRCRAAREMAGLPKADEDGGAGYEQPAQ